MRRWFKYLEARAGRGFFIGAGGVVYRSVYREGFEMKAYIVLEGADIGPPRDNADMVYGVFLTEERAAECVERHARYMDSLEGQKLIRKGGKVTDRHGNVYIQVLEVELDACRRETWI